MRFNRRSLLKYNIMIQAAGQDGHGFTDGTMQRVVVGFMVVMRIITAVVLGADTHPGELCRFERFALFTVLFVVVVAQVNPGKQRKLRQVEQDQKNVEVPLHHFCLSATRYP
jgi:hypothetical protein